jgi:hypothetical protein
MATPGRVFVLVGAGMPVGLPFVPTDAIVIGTLVALMVLLGGVMVYSYRVWRSDPDKRTT